MSRQAMNSDFVIAALTRACQLFTQGLGDYPMLGAPKTAEALRWMRACGVDPIWHGQAPLTQGDDVDGEVK
jgi:hypothetical protein